MNPIDIALICKSLGDATRLQIMQILADGEKSACELLEKYVIPPPTLSYHMKTLTECGLVEVRKDGKWSHYSISCETLQAFKTFVSGLYCTKSSGDCACR